MYDRTGQSRTGWIRSRLPWVFVGLAGIGWEWVASQMDSMGVTRSRRGYRDVPADEDVQILRFEDEE